MSKDIKKCNVKKVFIGATLLFLVILFTIAIVGSIYTGRSIDECFFGVVVVGFMLLD